MIILIILIKIIKQEKSFILCSDWAEPWKLGERNRQQKKEAEQKQRSKKVNFKEMHYHRYYS